MKVIRLSACFICVAALIIAVSALAGTTGTHAARETSGISTRVDLPQSNRTVVPPTKLSAIKAQRKLASPTEASAMPVDAAYAAHADGNGAGGSGDGRLGPASRYAPGPAETLAFGIVLLVGGGFLRRRRRTDTD
jgi:hypothetical protein